MEQNKEEKMMMENSDIRTNVLGGKLNNNNNKNNRKLRAFTS